MFKRNGFEIAVTHCCDQVISGLRALKEQENSSSNSINGAGRGSSSNMEAGTGAGPVAGGMADLSAEDASRPAVQHARERLMQVWACVCVCACGWVGVSVLSADGIKVCQKDVGRIKVLARCDEL
eukprot:1153316-Pelagomonas_calceolata.AAC.8